MKPLLYGLIATTALIPAAYAESKKLCAFNKEAFTKFEHKIEKSEVVKRLIIDLDKEKELQSCRITVKGTIDGKEYEESGMFTFGPEMSRNDACGHAEDRAKERLLSLNSPQVFNGSSTMKCGQQPGPSVVAHPKPKVDIEPLDEPKKKPREIVKKETVTLEPIETQVTYNTNYDSNMTITYMPQRLRHKLIKRNIGNWARPYDGRMRYSNVGPVAKCRKVHMPVMVEGYRVLAFKEVCNER